MNDYVKVLWHHELPGEPTVLYSEVAEGWEVRKVEVRRDGAMTFASASLQTGDTRLAEVPFPSIEEIGRDAQFSPETITRHEFEAVWMQATSSQQ